MNTIIPGKSPALRRRLKNGMHVLLCKHICDGQPIAAWDDGGRFYREDGTTGDAAYIIACRECTLIPRPQIVSLEYVWKIDRFHSADNPCQRYDVNGRLHAPRGRR